MKYSEFIKKCSLRLGLPEPQVKMISNCIFEEILISISNGFKVKIIKFGTFELKQRANAKISCGYIKVTQHRLVRNLFKMFKKFNQ